MSSDTEYKQVSSNADEYIILKALLDAGNEFVSGSRLASTLGVSRPAVWGKLEKLRDFGFEVEAVRNRGYRLIKQPNVFHPALLRYAQGNRSDTLDVLYFPVIDSTNSEADRQISFGRQSPFAIASSCQLKGRGRLGREWYSASADNLYLSVLFEPKIPAQQLQHFTLWAGVHICRALQRFVPDAPLKIKWPNDLHCDGRKFAGMLTEAKMDADGIKTIVFGVGINLNSNPMDYPDELRNLATSLYAIHGEELPLNDVTAAVLKAIQTAYQYCIGSSDGECLSEAWAPLNALAGKSVTALMSGNAISGIATGIDESGALLLENEDGTTHTVLAGDVTLKKPDS
ncbi:biotin--[acetyl-CoA-carboxylase] ligase [Coraliomargarita akajimensis]|uniref:Bifunctional ligase/repressor BirA n=1 Tax=Coraliomargarita akajimensis (strain DSM 45221 / IAM 15411 / JCM 23193 / KCTC 12865 / 04OKA010-24) TaxID=583355 RepID=D5ELJ7_CORAD|nr:biotin--[acetyl-CoA-carboxylase] ligase [Coraliomargarita akajimensis]ADE55133.1 biotin/acetyl-CoA-carboxylase ligase [Coraliomargarita akajimensis DSM 45221]